MVLFYELVHSATEIKECKKKESVQLSHLSGHISGEVTVRGKLYMAPVSSSVIHNINLSRLMTKKKNISQ